MKARSGNLDLALSNLDDLLSRFTNERRRYLCLRVLGAAQEESLKLLGKGRTVYYYWVSDPAFAEVEKHLVQHRGQYIDQAFQVRFNNILAMGMTIIENLLIKGAKDWDNLSIVDKQCIIRALDLAKTGGLSSKKVDKEAEESYDGYIRKHRG